ncbi:MAG: glycosyltransferase family 2 protein [Candidatus Bathyarchaeales archaeon]
MEKGERLGISSVVIVAALNEEEGIGPTLAEIKSYLGNPFAVVVDGRSVDGTAKIAEAEGAKVIPQKGFGKGDAIATALEHMRGLDAKYAVFIDADFTYPAEYLPKMFEILESNPKVGMVCGNRFNGHFRLSAMPNMFYVGNRFLAFMHNLLNGVQLRDPLTGLRVVRWEIIKNWTPKSRGFDVEVELNHLVERKGYQIIEVPIRYRQRLGEKKLKPKHGFAILKRILIESI